MKFLFIFLVITLITAVRKGDSKNKGPFYSCLLNAEPCGRYFKASKPYEKNPEIYIHIKPYNTSKKISLMRVNLTMTKESSPKNMIKIRGYKWKEGQWRIMFNFNNIACDGLLRVTIAKFYGFKNSCKLPKGNYYFEGLDYNQMEHFVWSTSREYGRWLWVSEYFVKQKTHFCLETEVITTPAST